MCPLPGLEIQAAIPDSVLSSGGEKARRPHLLCEQDRQGCPRAEAGSAARGSELRINIQANKGEAIRWEHDICSASQSKGEQIYFPIK